MATDLRLRLVHALLATRWPYFTSQPVGAIANAFATEAKRSSEAFLSGTALLAEGIALLVYAGVALATSWQLTLLALPVGLLGLAGFDPFTRGTRGAGRRQTELLREAISRLTEIFQGVRPLKAMALEERVGPLLERSIEKLNRALRRRVLAREAMLTLQEMLLLGCATRAPGPSSPSCRGGSWARSASAASSSRGASGSSSRSHARWCGVRSS